ncbi:hypothetical protein [Sphingomonas aerolata]|uniref:hypothetical protein n=1 Tax=Sphingomonas aerolata TaxID=185951 RepID=UPI003A5BD7F0
MRIKLLDRVAQPAQHVVVAGRGVGRRARQRHQRHRAKARRQPLQPPCRGAPRLGVGCVHHSVQRVGGAVGEGEVQVGDQQRIVPDRGCQGGVDCSGIIGHEMGRTRDRLNGRLRYSLCQSRFHGKTRT